ncbi:TPA: VENN motif pre-toxin domain-containing protein, partial [Escherichia coli]
VAEQTGMFAGDGGFDITVGRHTQLDGAVIASTATPDKNHLDTGTLGFSDLHNEADYKVSHSGISLSGGGSFGDKFQGNMPGGMISAGGHSGHAEGTTQAAVAEGTITIRDRDNQKQNLANLSRDPVHANDSISPIFDKEKEQNRLKEIGMISDIGGQVADIARTQGELNALKVAQDKYGPLQADATEEQRQAYLAKLRDTPEYKKEQEKYGTGSDMQRGIQAATAALQGLAGGNMAGALAGASAPELANIIGHHAGIDDNTAAKAIAHAILGGVTAALQGNSAAAGAIGAGTGEVIASAIAKSLYPGVDPSKLTEDQKQTVSTLATLSAGMAGGIASGDVAGAAAGAGAGKNVVENNSLSEAADYLVTGKKPEDRYRDAQQQLKEAVDEFKAKNCAGLSADACSTKMDAHRDELLAGAIEFGSDFIPVYSDIKSFAEADSALSYLAAIVGIMPGLGDTAGKAIKGAEKALKAGDLETASKLINKASDEIQAVKALDVGSYKELKDRSVVGDGLEHDHIPSFAAIRQAKENELGRKLTPAEEKKLYNNATAIEVPKDVHQAGPTYGGKNTSSQVKQDAINLCGAECRDTDALRKNMLERGYDPKLVDDAIKQLKERNSQIGVIK